MVLERNSQWATSPSALGPDGKRVIFLAEFSDVKKKENIAKIFLCTFSKSRNVSDARRFSRRMWEHDSVFAFQPCDIA